MIDSLPLLCCENGDLEEVFSPLAIRLGLRVSSDTSQL